MPLKLDEVLLLDNEKEVKTLERLRVETKGIGPTIQVLANTKIKITNKRLIIAQKILFSSKYQVKFILWFNDDAKEKLHLFAGSIELSIKPENVTETHIKDKFVTEIRPISYLEYIRIYTGKSDLNL